jgi:hypothetical protein
MMSQIQTRPSRRGDAAGRSHRQQVTAEVPHQAPTNGSPYALPEYWVYHVTKWILLGADMRLLRTKVWSWFDIALLKSSALLFGAIIGAYLSDFVKQYVLAFLLAAIALAIRPAITYFRDND